MLRRHHQILLLQGAGDLDGGHGAVEVALVVGIGLDRDRGAHHLVEEGSQTGQTLTRDLLELRLVLRHHPLVVLGSDRGQPLGQEIVERVATLHLDHFALLPEVLDVVDEEELDAAALALGELPGVGVDCGGESGRLGGGGGHGFVSGFGAVCGRAAGGTD